MKESDSGEKVYDRVDNYWAKVFGIQTATGDKKFNLLARVVKSPLCIHHGNVDAERSLSDNKNTVTDERTRLSELTINGLRLAKDFVNAHDGDVSKVMITKEMLQAGRNAHRTYYQRLDEEKEEAEQRKKLKLADIAEARAREEEKKEVNKEKDKLKEKEKSLRTSEIAQKEEMKAAEQLIVEGSKRLAKAIAKKDFTEAHVASALIDGARKKLEKAKTEDDQNIKKRKEIDEKKGKMIDYLSRSHKESKK